MTEHGVTFSGERWSRSRDRLGGLPRRRPIFLAWPAAAPPLGRFRHRLHRVAVVLVAVGLLSMSWDRFLNIEVASYNVKLPSLAFTVAAAFALVSAPSVRDALLRPGIRLVIAVLTSAIVIYEAVRGIASAVPAAALAQVAAVLSGAVLPAVALLLVLRSTRDLRWALTWVLAGAVIAAVFGLYQLTAFYLGWPQGIEYSGVGIGTGIGRIAAFNYEPAYFAYFIVLALGAAITMRRLDGAELGWRAIAAFGVILYLANVRAAPLVAVAFGVLLLAAPMRNRTLLLRGSVVLVATVALALGTPLIAERVQALQAQLAQGQAGGTDHDPPAGSAPPSTDPAQGPASAGVPSSGGAAVIQSQLQSVNPTEQSSNAPRLGLYTAVLQEVARSPIVGIGPGNLGAALTRNAPGAIQDQIGGQVVANNIWLQALADGGVIQLLLEVAFLTTILVAALRRRATPIYPMVAAWLAVIGVGGMLTSYFFDLKIWVVLALVLVGFSTSSGNGVRNSARDVTTP